MHIPSAFVLHASDESHAGIEPASALKNPDALVDPEGCHFRSGHDLRLCPELLRSNTALVGLARFELAASTSRT